MNRLNLNLWRAPILTLLHVLYVVVLRINTDIYALLMYLLVSLIQTVPSFRLPDSACCVEKEHRLVLPNGTIWIISFFLGALLSHEDHLCELLRIRVVPVVRANPDFDIIRIAFRPVDF